VLTNDEKRGPRKALLVVDETLAQTQPDLVKKSRLTSPLFPTS